MRNHSTELRSDPFDQHLVVDGLTAERTTDARTRAGHAMRHVACRRSHRIASRMCRMHDAITDTSSTATTAARIQEIHQAGAQP
ncbi:MAG: hypothetical protein GEU82_14780 [Luteitalea sp.]|nr:hypothetical protein [Luteitalea sp.]